MPIEVIPNFVDTAAYVPAPTLPTGAPPVLLHNSNFRPLKRIDDVLRIFAKVRARRASKLVLIGDGPERARAEQLAQTLGVAGSVEFLGERRDFIEQLQQARVFLLPSESESFGLAALEAMSCGVPVVASRIGGLPELIEEGVSGFLAPVGDVDAMAAAALRLLEDGALHTRMSTQARALAMERFRLAPAVDRYLAHYRRVLGES